MLLRAHVRCMHAKPCECVSVHCKRNGNPTFSQTLTGAALVVQSPALLVYGTADWTGPERDGINAKTRVCVQHHGNEKKRTKTITIKMKSFVL